MNPTLFDILDDCLNRLESGEDIESCLGSYPQHASELRQLLVAALDALSLAPAALPAEALKRNKARVLGVADEMRERKARGWAFLPRVNLAGSRAPRVALTVVLIIVLAFAATGTGLVYASNGTLPGDQLYPLKRGWEGIRLQLAYNPVLREELESEFESERIVEVNGLIGEGRQAGVEFIGQVTEITSQYYMIAGIPVLTDRDTDVNGNISLDSIVKVEGKTLPNNSVLASEIKVISNSENKSDDDTLPLITKTPENNNPGKLNEDTETPEADDDHGGSSGSSSSSSSKDDDGSSSSGSSSSSSTSSSSGEEHGSSSSSSSGSSSSSSSSGDD